VLWLPKALLGLAAGGSFALNVAHAPTHIGARVVAALAPAALVLTFEILMMIVRRAVAARVTRLSAQLASGPSRGAAAGAASAWAPGTGEGSAVLPPAHPERSTRVPTAGRRRSEGVVDRTAEVRRLYLDGITVAGEIARRLSIPPSTTRRMLAKVKQELAAPSNGGEHRGERLDGSSDEQESATDRSPAPSADDQPDEQALVLMTRGM
jgi:hypothetical protein